MWTLIKTNLVKQKHQHFMLYSLLCTLLSSFLGIFIFAYNRSVFKEFTNIDFVLWAQGAMFFASIFYPIFIAIFVSLDLDNEYQNKAIRQLITIPTSLSKIVWSKFLSYLPTIAVSLICYEIIFVTAVFLLKINVVDLAQTFIWLINGFIGICAMLMMQIWLYLLIKRKTTVILIACAGTIVSYVILLVLPQLILLDPYIYLSYGMRAQINFANVSTSQTIFFLIWALVLTYVFSLLAKRSLVKGLR